MHVLTLFQMRVDVLYRYRGVINQYSDRQRQAAQGHDINGFT